MPCQLILNLQYPHQLQPTVSRNFNANYVTRSIELFARCTWSPRIVNPIDQALDWSPESDFVKMYLDSVRWVLGGEKPRDAYHELSWKKLCVFQNLNERVHDEPINSYDAMLLMGALTDEPGKGVGANPNELERLLTDAQYVGQLNDQRETVIESYAAREQTPLIALETGELQSRVASENWVGSSDSSTTAASTESSNSGGAE